MNLSRSGGIWPFFIEGFHLLVSIYIPLYAASGAPPAMNFAFSLSRLPRVMWEKGLRLLGFRLPHSRTVSSSAQVWHVIMPT